MSNSQASSMYHAGATTYVQLTTYGDRSTTDSINAWPPRGDGLRDVGCDFFQEHFLSDSTGFMVHAKAPYSDYVLKGPIFAYITGTLPGNHSSWLQTAGPSAAVLAASGSTAISRCAPTNPHASLSQALGELKRDGIPAIPGLHSFQKGARPIAKARKSSKSRKKKPQTMAQPHALAGSEYLNVEFGWKPLLSDIRKLARAQDDSKRVIEQYVRDSGRLVRRRYEFPTETVTTVYDMGMRSPAGQTGLQLMVSQGRLTRTVTVKTRMWFSGAFTYHVSDAESILGRVRQTTQMANHLMGAGITPAAAWDLMPYSWAVDWITNIGDVVNNVSMMSSDGLVIVHAYVMAETTTTQSYVMTGVSAQNSSGTKASLVPPLTQSFTHVRRRRVRATPFGFGLTLGSFTPRQLAIVAALGLSRDGRALAL